MDTWRDGRPRYIVGTPRGFGCHYCRQWYETGRESWPAHIKTEEHQLAVLGGDELAPISGWTIQR